MKLSECSRNNTTVVEVSLHNSPPTTNAHHDANRYSSTFSPLILLPPRVSRPPFSLRRRLPLLNSSGGECHNHPHSLADKSLGVSPLPVRDEDAVDQFWDFTSSPLAIPKRLGDLLAFHRSSVSFPAKRSFHSPFPSEISHPTQVSSHSPARIATLSNSTHLSALEVSLTTPHPPPDEPLSDPLFSSLSHLSLKPTCHSSAGSFRSNGGGGVAGSRGGECLGRPSLYSRLPSGQSKICGSFMHSMMLLRSYRKGGGGGERRFPISSLDRTPSPMAFPVNKSSSFSFGRKRMGTPVTPHLLRLHAAMELPSSSTSAFFVHPPSSFVSLFAPLGSERLFRQETSTFHISVSRSLERPSHSPCEDLLASEGVENKSRRWRFVILPSISSSLVASSEIPETKVSSFESISHSSWDATLLPVRYYQFHKSRERQQFLDDALPFFFATTSQEKGWEELLPPLLRLASYSDCMIGVAAVLENMVCFSNTIEESVIRSYLPIWGLLCDASELTILHAVIFSLRALLYHVSYEVLECIVRPMVWTLMSHKTIAPRVVGTSLLVDLVYLSTMPRTERINNGEMAEIVPKGDVITIGTWSPTIPFPFAAPNFRIGLKSPIVAMAVKMFLISCKNSNALLQQVAIGELWRWHALLEFSDLEWFPLPQLDYFARSSQHDIVRITLVEGLLNMVLNHPIKALTSHSNEQPDLPEGLREGLDIIPRLVEILASTPSWRVRLAIAQRIGEFTKNDAIHMKELVKVWMCLAEDRALIVRLVVVEEWIRLLPFIPEFVWNALWWKMWGKWLSDPETEIMLMAWRGVGTTWKRVREARNEELCQLFMQLLLYGEPFPAEQKSNISGVMSLPLWNPKRLPVLAINGSVARIEEILGMLPTIIQHEVDGNYHDANSLSTFPFTDYVKSLLEGVLFPLLFCSGVHVISLVAVRTLSQIARLLGPSWSTVTLCGLTNSIQQIVHKEASSDYLDPFKSYQLPQIFDFPKTEKLDEMEVNEITELGVSQEEIALSNSTSSSSLFDFRLRLYYVYAVAVLLPATMMLSTESNENATMNHMENEIQLHTFISSWISEYGNDPVADIRAHCAALAHQYTGSFHKSMVGYHELCSMRKQLSQDPVPFVRDVAIGSITLQGFSSLFS